MNVVNQVHETNDYSMFRTLEGNRQVNKLHVKRLKDSFQKAYLLSPIIVNDKFEIIDGQHRFEAAKQSGFPINFLIAPKYGLKEVQALNANMKNWSKVDYLNAYCDLNHPEYLKFRQFMNRYTDFGIAVCQTLLMNKPSQSYSSTHIDVISESNKQGKFAIRFFQEGDLVIPDYNLAVENAEKIMKLKPYYEGFNRNTFVSAMISIFKINYYNHNKLIDRLNANPTALQHCTNITQYKLLIEEIYNYRSRDKVSLRF